MDILQFCKRYSLFTFAILGLIAGMTSMRLNPDYSSKIFLWVLVVAGIPLAFRTLTKMMRGEFNVDTIATLAIISTFLDRQFLAGNMVIIMQTGGEALEDWGLRRANRSLDNLLRRAPSMAHRLIDDQIHDVQASEVKIDDLLAILPGDIIAADGVLTKGAGSVDEAALTGEPVPLTKSVGDKVYSGTVNLSGTFVIRASNTAAASKYELIVKMVQSAQGEQAPINRLANKFAPFFTLFTLIAATLTYLLAQDHSRAVAVLVVATPCPLIIATPLAVISAINRAAALNIIVKSGAAIEQAGLIDVIVFDKTGTVTMGQPSLAEVKLFATGLDTLDEQQIVRMAASLEALSSHVAAQALVKEARDRKMEIIPASETVEAPGSGIRGMVDGKLIHVGSADYFKVENITMPSALQDFPESLVIGGKTVSWFALDKIVIAALIFKDKIRPESPEMFKRLSKLKLKEIMLLTGDNAITAKAVATSLGITKFKANMHPEEKLEVIKEYRKTNTVMMVGDGINDAPALATANVGVAMGSFGAGVATDAADIVIAVENVERVVDIIILGRTMQRVALQGIVFGLGASILMMGVASVGWIGPTTGAICQEFIDLAAILNAFRSK